MFQRMLCIMFYLDYLVSADNWKLVEIYWQIRTLIFFSHQNLDNLKVPKYAIAFDLSRHAKSSLTATTGFMSSINIATEIFPLLTSISANNYPVRSLRLTSDGPKGQEIVFNLEPSQFSKPDFPITTNLMSSFKVLI